MIKTIYFVFFICAFALGLWACTGKEQEKFKSLSTAHFEQLIKDNKIQLVDVRTVAEYVMDENFAAAVDELLQKDQPVAVYCKSGRRSRNAAKLLVKKGFKVYNLDKGILNWIDEGMEIEK